MNKKIQKNTIPLAFDENNANCIDRNKIDWEKIIEKSITKKVEPIFKAMKWEMDEVKPKKIKKEPTTQQKECSPNSEHLEKVNIKAFYEE